MTTTETIGLDLGGTKLLTGVLDESSEVLWKRRVESSGLSEEATQQGAEGCVERI